MKKNIAVVGTVGIPACYGGFESLVENLTKESSNNIQYTVFCSSENYKKKLCEHNGAKLIYLPFRANGMQSVVYDIVSLFLCVFKRYDSVLILGVSGCLFLPVFRLLSKAKIITNIDGLEWKRDKWSKLAKVFLKLSEAIAVKYSDVVIADNQAIGDYVTKEYGKSNEIIAYGGDHALISSEIGSIDNYFLSVCRIEPENNVHIILEAFSNLDEKIIFIGNWDSSEYGLDLKERYSKFDNIEILEPIYDVKQLYFLRRQCIGYIHGHSAGGTNPSLVEIMHFSKPVFSFDCSFNRYSTENASYYFSDVASLTSGVISFDFATTGLEMGRILKEIAQRRYTWNVVKNQYESFY
ncbi:Alpha-D-GlcNAc alpha-1,2-L-rhamnosyltransferase [Vibrio chagasii]|nr:Alpha-D-GlcNAc alpha-1,2-L-rhamnosyltransferase [Vibrio chagasii]CAH7237206.1 Alpha-D-GlcNAc alpha-1,2-L-rhamnosyltransferase [Vibrio chagasii]CAH7238386.1 Alpha-D-GlcNAc alpha-1,2-L-rhamnosyltransferase [Vibrio chagasii]CAH7436860.1 Alpha-D-GlcNAc alpha-1,2-L-rhamnosyltransferase [Vibrio chagasii]